MNVKRMSYKMIWPIFIYVINEISSCAGFSCPKGTKSDIFGDENN